MGIRTGLTVVHDYVTQRGGAERVVLDMLDTMPSPRRLITSVYHPEGTYPGFARHPITTTALDRVPAFRRDPRTALPLLAPTFSSIRLDEPVVLVSSSGWAHGIRNEGAKVVYCHTPAHWLYERDEYMSRMPAATKPVLAALSPALRRWDQNAAHSPRTLYVANSTTTQERIRRAYGMESVVIPPPVRVEPRDEVEPLDIEPGYLMTVGRNRGYKNIEAVCAAMRHLPDQRLVVVGGPVPDHPSNVTVVSGVSDAQLAWLYQNTAGLVALAFEDFGLTPVECNAQGRPVLALRRGGYLDSVAEGVNGLFVDGLEPEVVAEGVGRLLAHPWDRQAILDHAAGFGPQRFLERLGEVMDRAETLGGAAGSSAQPAPA